MALDGPASSGKSSVGAAAALQLGYRFCDTGLLYRSVTWLSLQRRMSPGDVPALVALAEEVHLAPDHQGRLDRVVVDGKDVTEEVHTAAVDQGVSEIAAVGEVRAALLPRQRARRRIEERGIAPDSREAGEILSQLRRRDELDRTRAVAPLRPATDAHILQTDSNRFEQTVGMVVKEIAAAEEARSSQTKAPA